MFLTLSIYFKLFNNTIYGQKYIGTYPSHYVLIEHSRVCPSFGVRIVSILLGRLYAIFWNVLWEYVPIHNSSTLVQSDTDLRSGVQLAF